jgi:hypothetical protein
MKLSMTTFPVLLQFAMVAAVVAATAPVRPFEAPGVPQARSKGDRLVFARLQELGIEPAGLCSDAVFVRRVYLDVIGTLPTLQETKRFLQDKSPNKRSVLIDRLLEREEFADYWSMKWCDLLRVKAEFPINLWPNAVQAYHRWIRTAVKENMPYDQFARALLTSSGSNFRVAPVNFYRSMQSKEPEALAKGVALTFMGARTEKWPREKLSNLAAFFSQIGFKRTAEWKEEIVFHDPWTSSTNAPLSKSPRLVFPDGKTIGLEPPEDPRELFAAWLIRAENPWFTRNICNRAWYWLVGQGIVHEPDDVRPDNPPSNPELLDWLVSELVSSKYDVKHVFRKILNSTTYQLSSIPRSKHPKALANFAYYPLRRLDAEVLVDALCQLTGTTEKYSSQIPEPFTFIPEQQRSIALADGSITSPFLEMFGRPPRDTGMESERNNQPSAAQRLHLLNSTHIQRKFVQSKKLKSLLRTYGKEPRETVNAVYLTFLSRLPTDKERMELGRYAKKPGAKGWEIPGDLMWALVNSKEFLYRH